MKIVKTTSFCKQASCPSSATLLSYQKLGLGSTIENIVGEHLEVCDFCCAELQLLTECPQDDVDFSMVESIPAPLRLLAEEIFAGSFLTADTFLECCFEKTPLTFTDA